MQAYITFALSHFIAALKNNENNVAYIIFIKK